MTTSFLSRSFNSLRTGKYIWTSHPWGRETWPSATCFNSLRTGKYIWTCPIVILAGIVVGVFQFPTNGKVHLNLRIKRSKTRKKNVSIPYERESTSEPFGIATVTSIALTIGFNSLRTGKYIWTEGLWKRSALPWQIVSIPYERESTSERGSGRQGQTRVRLVSIPYERESTSEP